GRVAPLAVRSARTARRLRPGPTDRRPRPGDPAPRVHRPAPRGQPPDEGRPGATGTERGGAASGAGVARFPGTRAPGGRPPPAGGPRRETAPVAEDADGAVRRPQPGGPRDAAPARDAVGPGVRAGGGAGGRGGAGAGVARRGSAAVVGP